MPTIRYTESVAYNYRTTEKKLQYDRNKTYLCLHVYQFRKEFEYLNEYVLFTISLKISENNFDYSSAYLVQWRCRLLHAYCICHCSNGNKKQETVIFIFR